MSHTISGSMLGIYRKTTPPVLYEANYRHLNRLIPDLKKFKLNKIVKLPITRVDIEIIEQHKYTSIIAIKQALKTSMIQLATINLKVRVCHDAGVAEVIGYQGKSPVQSAQSYPNKQMLQIDEKKQLNLLLKEVLENMIKNKFSKNKISSIL